MAATSMKPGHVVAWHPGGLVYAMLGKSATGVPTLMILRSSSVAPPTVLQTIALAVPAGLDLSTLQLTAMAYSPDGSRILVAGSGARAGGFLTIAYLAAVATGGLVSSPFSTVSTPLVGAAAREEVLDVSFHPALTPEIATTRRVYTLSGVGGASTLTPVFSKDNLDAAFDSTGRVLAFSVGVTAPGLQLASVIIGSSTVATGPLYGYGIAKGQVAITPDAKLFAAVAQDGIRVFDHAFALVSRLPDTAVSGVRFRPAP
jgi:hypothetical protein